MTAVKGERLGGDGNVEPLQTGDRIGSGEFFALYLQVDSPRYVYAVQFQPNGKGNVLYDGTSPAHPHEWVRIPEDTASGLQTDNDTGEERIYVVTSPRPLKEVDADIANAVHLVRATLEQPAPAGSLSTTVSVPAPNSAAPVQSASPVTSPQPGPSTSTRPPTPPPVIPTSSPTSDFAFAREAQTKLASRRRGVHVKPLPGKHGTAYEGATTPDGLTVDLFVLDHH
jgi:hypothetical protein